MTYSLGCCMHAHMNGLCKVSIARAKLGTLANDALDRESQGEWKGSGRRRPIHLSCCFPGRGRANQPEEGSAYASRPACLSCLWGLELGIAVPTSPPPSPSWLQEQRPPLSRLSLENSASRSPASAHMSPSPSLVSLVRDGWSRNNALIPSTKLLLHLLDGGWGGSPYPPLPQIGSGPLSLSLPSTLT